MIKNDVSFFYFLSGILFLLLFYFFSFLGFLLMANKPSILRECLCNIAIVCLFWGGTGLMSGKTFIGGQQSSSFGQRRNGLERNVRGSCPTFPWHIWPHNNTTHSLVGTQLCDNVQKRRVCVSKMWFFFFIKLIYCALHKYKILIINVGH